jgi:multidrug transporter EmrE-like cation transporter
MPYLLIFIATLLNTGAQLFLKLGATRLEKATFSFNQIIPLICQLSTNAPIILGLASYVISVFVWIWVLSRMDVSLDYPLMSMGYVITAVFAALFFYEPLTWTRCIGIATIMLGVYFMTISSRS